MFKPLQSKINNIIQTVSLIVCLTWNICPSPAQQVTPNKIRLALFIDKGAHLRTILHDNIAQDTSFSTSYITGADICNGCLNNIDVLFIPGGSGKREALSLTPEGQNKVRLFVRNGGIYLGVCAGCYLASCAQPEYLGLFPMTTVDKTHWRRGKATLPIEFTPLGMEIFAVKKAKAEVVYHNGPVLKAYEQYADKITTLCYFRGEIVAPEGKAGVMINAPAIVLAQYGNGLVLGISPHPEATPALATIELNAIHWLFNHRPLKQSFATNINSIQSNPISTYNKTLSDTIYNKAKTIFDNTEQSHYQHLHDSAEEQVQIKNSKYQVTSDCSGFVSYVIDSVAPKHYEIISELSRRSYPHAGTYVQLFSQLPPNKIINGWLRLNSIKDLQRGDIIAWERISHPDRQVKQKGSGHVMIVSDPPGKTISTKYKDQTVTYVEVNVIDSSSVEHFPPQSLPPLAHQQYRDGVGKGIIRLILDNQNNVIGFWEGTYSHEKNEVIKGPSYTDKIAFARLISIQ